MESREWKKQKHGVSYILISFVGRTNKGNEICGHVTHGKVEICIDPTQFKSENLKERDHLTVLNIEG